MADKTPLISVLVPIYNIERYIGQCIESLIEQEYKNLEIILVDDGSTDRSPEICNIYEKKDNRIKVIHKKNGGLVSARKVGLEAAKGKYIGYVDGDDWIEKDFYYSLYNSIIKYDADVVIGGYSRDLFDKKTCLNNAFPFGFYEGEKLKNLYIKMISYGDFYRHGVTTYLWNKLFKREIVYPYQMNMDERISIAEDAAVVYPLLLNSSKIVITDNHNYHYRQREDSMLKTIGNFHNESFRLKVLYEYLLKTMSDSLEDYNIRQQLDDLILSTYIIRSGGSIESNDPQLKFFPLGRNLSNKKIVLYGAGTFGQQLIKKLENSHLCKVVGWIDEDYKEYRRCCMDVDPIESVKDINYDYVLIANLNMDLAKEIKKELINCSVMPEKIITLSTSPEERKIALNEYLKQSGLT